ncbi:MAG: THUMP domain-containing protein [Parachlamydiaceae bacterium]
MDLFVTCGQGIEQLLAQELGTIGYPQGVTGFRGVTLQDVDLEAVYRINYLSRLAGRVFLPLSRFYCQNEKTLYAGTGKVDWLAYLPEGKTIAVDANVNHPQLRNSLFAAQVVKDAICDQIRQRAGWRPSVDVKNPDVQINLFIYREWAVVSVDTSGQSLHKRGYRQETVEAPMQETLAAALLSLSGYKGTEVLYDPCCGSGTLLTEAALIATHTPPGFLRARWGFFYLPKHSQELWLKVKAEADSKRIPLPKGMIYGTDVNKQAVYATKVNLRAAGLHHNVEVVNCDFRDYVPPVPPTFVITNPPHGNRLDDVEHLCPLYRALGDWMKRNTAKPAKGFVFTSSPVLAKEVGLATTRRHVIESGGVEARLLEYELY